MQGRRLAGSRPADQRAVIERLHKLCTKLHQAQSNRVEFLCLAFKNGLGCEIRHYTLWDEGWEGLGERQWGDCFEYGDAEAVIADVVTRARKEGFLDAIRDYCTVAGAYERWLSCADRQACLF